MAPSTSRLSSAGDDLQMLVDGLQQRAAESGATVDLLRHAAMFSCRRWCVSRIARFPSASTTSRCILPSSRAKRSCASSKGPPSVSCSRHSSWSRPHIGQPFLGNRIAEAAQGKDLDHDAELVVLADERHLRVDDPECRSRGLISASPNSFEQHQGLAPAATATGRAARRARSQGDHHARLSACRPASPPGTAGTRHCPAGHLTSNSFGRPSALVPPYLSLQAARIQEPPTGLRPQPRPAMHRRRSAATLTCRQLTLYRLWLRRRPLDFDIN